MGNEKLKYDELGEVRPGKCDVRLSEEEMRQLNYMAENEDLTKSDIMRKALRFLFRSKYDA